MKFNEQTLLQEIVNRWGEYGSHAEVCKELIKRAEIPKEVKGELTVKKFMLKKFPTNEYMDCPVPKHHWETIQEYAEAYHASQSKQGGMEGYSVEDMGKAYNLGGENYLHLYYGEEPKTTFVEFINTLNK